uniref:Uncharacterized protein n=1 Tax=Opuntia streptacantha TaxID=393608 RepID=A0A7C8YYF0_OPUST
MAALLSESCRALVNGPLWIADEKEETPAAAAAAAAAAFSRACRLGGADDEAKVPEEVDLRFLTPPPWCRWLRRRRIPGFHGRSGGSGRRRRVRSGFSALLFHSSPSRVLASQWLS